MHTRTLSVCVRACVRACVCAVLCMLHLHILKFHVFVSLHHLIMRFHPHLLVQDQYMFIHDALADYITCGDTSILAQELSITMAEMCQIDKQTKKNRFIQQFEVGTYVQTRLSTIMYAPIFMHTLLPQ